MRSGEPDRVALAGGIACLLIAVVLGLDQLEVISLSLGLATAAICAAAGFVLVVSGLGPPARPRDRGPEDG